MPRGRYSLHDPHDGAPLGEEHFQCAAGPAGWRYAARVTGPAGEHTGSVDLTTDDLGRPLRLEVHAGSWRVRGGALDGVTWVRTDPSGTKAAEGRVAAHGFTGTSPAFLVATARLLQPQTGAGAARARLVALTPPVLAPRTLDQAWELLGTDTHPTDSGPLVVHAYRVTALDTGEQHTVHLAGDVVLSAPGVELEDLDSPPTAFAPR